MKRIAILGSTGSIGRSALDVVEAHPDRLRVVGLAAGENSELLAAQVARHHPAVVAMASGEAIERLARRRVAGRHRDRRRRARGPRRGGVASRRRPGPVRLVGHRRPRGRARRHRPRASTIALANKEVLVMAGGLVTEAARARGRRDPAGRQRAQRHPPVPARARAERGAAPGADRVGRPVPRTRGRRPRRGHRGRGAAPPDLADGTQDHHRLGDADEQGPRGDRGALALRCRRASQIDVVVHPQSVVHSMVELTDGSVIAQLGVTDMRLPIQYAFSYPDRWSAPLPALDLVAAGRLEFAMPDTRRVPLPVARVSRARGGAQPARGAERGERSRGGALPRGQARLHRHPAP